MVNWVLQTDIFQENQEQLQRAIRRADMTYEVVKHCVEEGYSFTVNDCSAGEFGIRQTGG